jgi:hypothetical protein
MLVFILYFKMWEEVGPQDYEGIIATSKIIIRPVKTNEVKIVILQPVGILTIIFVG